MGKTAVITGATSGIGLATALLLISKGYKVYGIARKPYAGGAFKCYSSDVCDYAEIDGILREINDNEGGIDVLVNCAGFGIAGATEDCTPENVRRMSDVNFTAVCVLCGKAVKYMKERGGRIINVSSVGGIVPLPYQSVYSAVKAATEVFSRALAGEVKESGIKVTAILPGDTRTGFTDARIFEGDNPRAVRSVNKMARDERNGVPPEKTAKVIYSVLNRKNPPPRKAVGFVSKLEIFLARVLPARTVDFIVRKIYG